MKNYGFSSSCSVVKDGNTCKGGASIKTTDGVDISTEYDGNSIDEVIKQLYNSITKSYENIKSEKNLPENNSVSVEEEEINLNNDDYVIELKNELESTKIDNVILEQRVSDLQKQVEELKAKETQKANDKLNAYNDFYDLYKKYLDKFLGE